jgi:uncharacterized protein DUF4124
MPRSRSIANSLKRTGNTLRLTHGGALPWVLALIAIAASLGWWYFAPETLPASVRTLVPASPRAMPLLYKWRDAKGGLHITDVPPTDRPYETVHYDPNVNVVPNVMPLGTHPPESKSGE